MKIKNLEINKNPIPISDPGGNVVALFCANTIVDAKLSFDNEDELQDFIAWLWSFSGEKFSFLENLSEEKFESMQKTVKVETAKNQLKKIESMQEWINQLEMELKKDKKNVEKLNQSRLSNTIGSLEL